MIPDAERETRPSHARLLLAAVIAISLALRVFLVLRGGQGYWPDEARYLRSRAAVWEARQGAWSAAVSALGQPDHVLFQILGLVPASVEPATRSQSRILLLTDATIPAIFFSLFSVASILLLYGIARRLGESEEASCLAALILALCATQLYYVRHLLPYDAAMALILGALYAGVRRPDRPRDSILCGALACAGFLTYNGYWLLAVFAGLAHVLRGPHPPRALVQRAALAGAGFAVPIAAIAAADAALRGDFFRRWAEFAETVTQGSYAEGWRLPFAFLWHAEHLLTVLWTTSFAYAATRLLRGDRRASLALGVGGILFVYAGLVLVSVGFHRFVVYGRHARQLLPFACLLSGVAVERLAQSGARGRHLAVAAIAASCVQAAIDLRAPLAQVFPDEFRRMAERVPNPDGAPRRLLYAGHIYPVPAAAPPYTSADEVLLSRPHPLQYLPYQYEGYTPVERAALRTADIRMRLLRVKAEASAPGR